MYKLEAKIKSKGRIAGYLLKDKEGEIRVVKIEDVKRVVDQIEGCKLTKRGYLALKDKKMSDVAEITKDKIKAKKSNRCKEVKVTDKEAIITTASKGDQSKWRVGDIWVKADTQGYEGLAEEVASIFLSCIEDIDYVPYHTCKIKKVDGEELRGCYSESMFKNEDEAYVTFHKLYEQKGLVYEETLEKQSTKERIQGTVEYIEDNYGVNVLRYLVKTLYIDAIILNEDRHPSNLGLIKDNRKGEYRTAPIFDNGLAFFARDTYWGNKPLFVAERELKLEPFGNKQIKALMSLSDYKLKINVKRLEAKLKTYKNSMYSESTVNRAKEILKRNLKKWEGKLWERK